MGNTVRGIFRMVRDKQQLCGPFANQHVDKAAHQLAVEGVQPLQRFIEDQQVAWLQEQARQQKTVSLTAGQRVEVPFGRMRKEGVVLSLTQETDVPPEKLRDILRPLEDYAAICPTLLTLAQQMADDVHCPLAETLRLMLPAQMRGGRIQVKTQTVAQAAKPREMLEAAALAEKRSPKRRLLLTVLSDGRTHPVDELKLLVREPLQALRQIEAAGLIALREEEVLRRPGGNTPDTAVPDPPLTPGQEEALSVMLPDLRSGQGKYLLHGVTGSGKTEVFIRLVRQTLVQGKSAMILVPEIALTPQMVMWFRARFGAVAAVLHSRLSPGERYDEWRRIRRGDVRVVIGARSAIFAPLENVGLIIIDEEHEQSYIADNNPHYDARQLAHERCAREGATLLLASATPSMRSFAMAGRGDLTLLEMPRRVNNRPMPTVHVVDMREELKKGNRSVFSGALSLGREAVSGYQLFSANAVAAGDWIRENTDRDDVFLTGQQHINPVCSLAGRQIICGSDLYVFFHGLDYAQQSADCRRFYENPRENADVLTKYDVHYIYVSDYERAEFDVDLDALDETYELIYENDDVRIYDTGWRETP